MFPVTLTPVPAVLVVALAVAVLLVAERAKRPRLRFAAKVLSSACFLFVAFASVRAPVGPAAAALLAGLCLGAAGDVALGVPGKRAFLAGLTAFLLGHVAYIAAFARLAPPAEWNAVAALVLAVCAAMMLSRLWSRLGSMRWPVALYVTVICTMVVAALAVFAARAPARELIAAGALLFAISDVAVARQRFVRESFVNKVWGLPTYYAGQLCLALSLAEL